METYEEDRWHQDEESTLPLEIWHIILTHKPRTQQFWLSLAACSRTLHAFVLNMAIVNIEAVEWPYSLLSRLTAPLHLTISEPYRSRCYPPAVFDSIKKRLTDIDKQNVAITNHLYGPIPIGIASPPSSNAYEAMRNHIVIERRRAVIDDSDEDSDEDSEESRHAGSDSDDSDDSDDSEEDYVLYLGERKYDVQEGQYAGGEQGHATEPAVRRNAVSLWEDHRSTASKRTRVGLLSSEDGSGTEGSSDGDTDDFQEGQILSECLAYQQGLDSIASSVGIHHKIVYLELPYRYVPVGLLPATCQTAKLPRAQFQHDLRPFPRSLTCLWIYSAYTAHGCPKGLLELSWNSSETPNSHVLPFLPPGLKSLKFLRKIAPEDIASLPKQLRSLHMDLSTWNDADVIFLPRHLRSVSLKDGRYLTRKCLKHLPRSLDHLELPSMDLTDEDVLSLPSTLRSLEMQNSPTSSASSLSSIAFHNLPIGVQQNPDCISGIFKSSYAHALLLRYPPDWLEFEWPSYFTHHLPVCACSDLPRTMRRLQVDGINWGGQDLAHLPPQLEVLILNSTRQFSAIDASLLPSTLISLSLLASVPTTHMIASLPENALTELILPQQMTLDDEAGLIKFPPLLKRLVLTCNFRTEQHFQSLPSGLTSLELGGSHLWDIGVKYLPRTLVHLSVPSDRSLTDAGVADLPATLRTLELDSNNFITDAGVAMLPRGLKGLILPHNTKITDEGVTALPRQLAQINLLSNTNFTLASIEQWPSEEMVLFEVNIQEMKDPNAETPHDQSTSEETLSPTC